MEQWKEYKLSDILSIVSGFAYKGEYLGKGESLLLGMGCVSYSELFLEEANIYSRLETQEIWEQLYRDLRQKPFSSP